MMMRGLLLLAAALANVEFTVAVFVDDAWKLDYHHALLGLPRTETTFFHQPTTSSKASLLYTLTERNVLGAVNPRDGSIVWRQALGDGDNATSSHLRGGLGQDTVVSLADDQLVAWTAQDGREAWRLSLRGAEVKDLEILEHQPSDVSIDHKDALLLTVEDGLSVVRRINGATGQVLWEHKDRTTDVALQLSASNTDIYLIALHSTMSSAYKIRATSLDVVSGRKTDQFTLSSNSPLAAVSDIVAVGANTASPIIAWTDKATKKLYINVIGNKAVSEFPIDQSGGSAQVVALHAPYHTTAQPHFLVHYRTETDHWADVFHVDLQSSTVTKAYSLARSTDRGAFAVTSIDANVFFTRVTTSDVLVYTSTSASQVAEWPFSGLSAAGISNQLDAVQLVSELNLRNGQISAARCAVLTSSGHWLLLRNGKLVWHRHEALAHTIAAAWVSPPADKTAIKELEEEAHSTVVHAYLHRLRRHARDLQYLPQLISGLPVQFLASISSWDASATEQKFGYQKLLVCITSHGRAIALDSVHGIVKWNVALRNAVAPLERVPFISADEDDTLLLRYSGGVNVRLNATTGQQVVAVAGPDDATMHIDFDSQKVFATPVGPAASTETAWQYLTNERERIISVTHRPIVDPVASIGKVLGDRHVMYKYLNPNLIMVCAQSLEATSFRVHLIDGATGTVLKTITHNDAYPGERLVAAMSDNWFAYAFTSSGPESKSRGSHLVVGELFESSVKNDRGPMVVNGSYDLGPHVVSQTYTIPEPISVMEVTQTGQGITSKVLLGVLGESQALIAIPRMALDPRRPVGRAATTVEMMEGLMQYTPVLDFDPRWFLSHQRSVVGLRNVTTSPAIVESTSLVFAYGLDVFGTRISPSGSFDVLGKDFNKLQMLATVVALGVVTLLVAPLVQRKQINSIWQL